MRRNEAGITRRRCRSFRTVAACLAENSTGIELEKSLENRNDQEETEEKQMTVPFQVKMKFSTKSKRVKAKVWQSHFEVRDSFSANNIEGKITEC